MPTKSEHRTAIRHAVITAAMDIGNFQWTAANDRLLDIIDKWLEGKEQAKPLDPSRHDDVLLAVENIMGDADADRTS